MAYEVAVRNPERYKGIIEVLYRYEGTILNDENIANIYTSLFTSGVVDSNNVDVDRLSPEQIKDYIIHHLSHKADGSFPEGYQSSFWRYLRTLSELGAIYSQYNEPLLISDASKALLDDKITQGEFFALQSLRTNRKSPYRRVLNDFNYCKFLVNLIRKMPRQRLSYVQFMVTLFSENGDVDAMKTILQNNRFGNDFDAAYEYIVNHYDKIDDDHDKVCKQNSCFNDYGNTVFKVMLLTGYFTVEKSGQMIMIGLNADKMGLFDSLSDFDFSLSEDEKEDRMLFFKKLGGFSPLYEEKIKIYREEGSLEDADYNEFLLKIAHDYDLTVDKVASMLISLCASNSNVRDEFWFIQKPLRFELYVSLLIYLYYGNKYKVHPNYSIDSNGMPYSPAPAGKGDIEIFGLNEYCLVEVTLMRSRDQQGAFESSNLFRHVTNAFYDKKYMAFIAPYVHPDTELLLQTMGVIQRTQRVTDCNKFSCKPMTAAQFVDSIKGMDFLGNIERYSDEVWNRIRG
ncbi:MAG: AlwI family type II restriction endonuclease [Bacilli bacterium]|nr:AlwI family type II restriction endonuclease [Bacilli bacterium]